MVSPFTPAPLLTFNATIKPRVGFWPCCHQIWRDSPHFILQGNIHALNYKYIAILTKFMRIFPPLSSFPHPRSSRPSSFPFRLPSSPLSPLLPG